MIHAARRENELFRVGTNQRFLGVIETGRDDASKVDLSADNSTFEAKVKELGDIVLKEVGWHCFAKATQRNPFEWWLWAGPIELRPREDWPK